MQKYICLRDDDTSFFTNLNELLDGYGEFWGKIPLTLGVVPFSHGSQNEMYVQEVTPDKYQSLRQWEINATARQLSEYHKLHPVGDNTTLVEELRMQVNKGMIEVAQHGVSHRYNEFGPETTSDQVALPMIRDGKEYLSKLFGKEIVTYIPPSNTIDEKCAKYVNSIGMNILSSGNITYYSLFEKIRSHLQDPNYIKSKILRTTIRPIKKPSGIYLLNSYTYNNYNSLDDVYHRLVNCLNDTGFASITTHYMLLRKDGWHDEHSEYRNNYHELINRLSNVDNISFVTASTYFKLLADKYYR